MISVGLSWKMAIGACVLGNTVMGLVITVNGRIGATVSVLCAFCATSSLSGNGADCLQLHTPFPVLARVSFGYYFSYFIVLSRCVLATVWLGSVHSSATIRRRDADVHCSTVFKLRQEASA